MAMFMPRQLRMREFPRNRPGSLCITHNGRDISVICRRFLHGFRPISGTILQIGARNHLSRARRALKDSGLITGQGASLFGTSDKGGPNTSAHDIKMSHNTDTMSAHEMHCAIVNGLLIRPEPIGFPAFFVRYYRNLPVLPGWPGVCLQALLPVNEQGSSPPLQSATR